MLLLEQDITKKKQIDQTNLSLLKPEKYLKFETRDNQDYKVKIIIDNAVYGQ